MRHPMPLAVALFAWSCASSDPNTAPTGPCSARYGTYRVTWVQQSGTCGPMQEQIFTVGAPQTTEAISACTDGSFASRDNCRVTIDTTCPGATGYRVATRGTVDWNAAGSEANGTVQVQITTTSTGAVACSSVYDVTYSRQ